MASQGNFQIPAGSTADITFDLTGLASAKLLRFSAITDVAADGTLGTPSAGTDAMFCFGYAAPGSPIKQYAFASVTAQGADYLTADCARVMRNDAVVARVKPDASGTVGKLSVYSIGTSGNYTVTLHVDEAFDVNVRVLWFAVTETGVSANIVSFNPAGGTGSVNLGAGGDAAIFVTVGVAAVNTPAFGMLWGFGYATATSGGVTDQFASGFMQAHRTTAVNVTTSMYSRPTHCLGFVNSNASISHLTASAFDGSNCTVTSGGQTFSGVLVVAILLTNVMAKTGYVSSSTTLNATSTFPSSALGWTPFGGLVLASGSTDRPSENAGAPGQAIVGAFVTATKTQAGLVYDLHNNSVLTDSRIGYRTTGGLWWNPAGNYTGGGKIGIDTAGAPDGFGVDPLRFKQTTADALAGCLMGVLLLGPKGSALVAGTLSLTSAVATSAALSSTSPSGGSGSITQQLYRTTRGGSSWSAVTGATSLTPTDATVAAGTRYDYKVTFTDGAAATADSNVVQVDVPQVGRPTTIDAQGSWTGAASDINEVSRNDATYIQSSTSPLSPDLFRVRLTALSTPAARTNHTVSYAIQKDASGGDAENLTVRLVELVLGVWTARASWVHLDVAYGAQLVTQSLTSGQANAIVDYGNLALEFEAVKG